MNNEIKMSIVCSRCRRPIEVTQLPVRSLVVAVGLCESCLVDIAGDEDGYGNAAAKLLPLTRAKTTLDLVRAGLVAGGFDGLYIPGECGCGLDDLCPCGNLPDDCKPGYKIKLKFCPDGWGPRKGGEDE